MNHRKLDASKVFFTSDTHFFHANIIKFCSRPFTDAEDMRKQLIANWNATVPEDAVVYHLGDFAYTGKVDWIRDTIEKLNGSIVLIRGNHDYQNRYERKGVTELFADIRDVLEITVVDEEVSDGMQRLFLSHYPHIVWPHSHRGSWQPFGHVHMGEHSTASEGGYVSSRISANQYDVGVDNNNYRPISYIELKVIITQQNLARL